MVSKYSGSVFDLNVKLTDELLDHTALYQWCLLERLLGRSTSYGGHILELTQGTQEFCQLQLDKLKVFLGATLSSIAHTHNDREADYTSGLTPSAVQRATP